MLKPGQAAVLTTFGALAKTGVVLYLTVVNVIPEPGTVTLLMLAGVGLVVAARRRKS